MRTEKNEKKKMCGFSLMQRWPTGSLCRENAGFVPKMGAEDRTIRTFSAVFNKVWHKNLIIFAPR
jgi:hypothetical protein